MVMDDPDREHLMSKQPTKEVMVKVKVMIMKWEGGI